MDIYINWVAVALATVVAMLVGSIWYSKTAFGGQWIKLVHLDEKKLSAEAVTSMVIALVTAFITACAVAFFSSVVHNSLHHSFLIDALIASLVAFIGFQLTYLAMNKAFEQRPEALMLINMGNQFVTLMAMAVTIAILN